VPSHARQNAMFRATTAASSTPAVPIQTDRAADSDEVHAIQLIPSYRILCSRASRRASQLLTFFFADQPATSASTRRRQRQLDRDEHQRSIPHSDVKVIFALTSGAHTHTTTIHVLSDCDPTRHTARARPPRASITTSLLSVFASLTPAPVDYSGPSLSYRYRLR
jgi:hypothetical protein